MKSAVLEPEPKNASRKSKRSTAFGPVGEGRLRRCSRQWKQEASAAGKRRRAFTFHESRPILHIAVDHLGETEIPPQTILKTVHICYLCSEYPPAPHGG